MVCLSCTGTGERVCLSAEGFGNRQCFLESIADKVGFIIKHLDTGHILHIPQQKSYTFTTHTAKCSVFFLGKMKKILITELITCFRMCLQTCPNVYLLLSKPCPLGLCRRLYLPTMPRRWAEILQGRLFHFKTRKHFRAKGWDPVTKHCCMEMQFFFGIVTAIWYFLGNISNSI